MAEVCRRHDIVTSMLFRWRLQFGFAQKKRVKLATVAMPPSSAGASSVPPVLHDLLQPPAGMMTVEMLDSRHVFVPAGSGSGVVRRHVLEREAQ